MMSFGWRPNISCYQGSGGNVAPAESATSQSDGCAVPTWFWALLGIATVAGLSSHGKGAK